MLGMRPFCRCVGRTGFSVVDSKESVQTNLPPKYKTIRISYTSFCGGPFFHFFTKITEKNENVCQGRAIAPSPLPCIRPCLYPTITYIIHDIVYLFRLFYEDTSKDIHYASTQSLSFSSAGHCKSHEWKLISFHSSNCMHGMIQAEA